MTGNQNGKQNGKGYMSKYALINSIETVTYENCKWLGPSFIYEANNRKEKKISTRYIKAGPNDFQIY
jgi:hypothetical protein